MNIQTGNEPLAPWRSQASSEASEPALALTYPDRTEPEGQSDQECDTPPGEEPGFHGLPLPWLKRGQIATVLAGSVTLIVGAHFGATEVLPTLASGPAALVGALATVLATACLCSLALSNAVGKANFKPTPHLVPEDETQALVLATLLAMPGLGGAFLVGSATATTLGGGIVATMLGATAGLMALATIGITTRVAADPEPVLSLRYWKLAVPPGPTGSFELASAGGRSEDF